MINLKGFKDRWLAKNGRLTEQQQLIPGGGLPDDEIFQILHSEVIGAAQNQTAIHVQFFDRSNTCGDWGLSSPCYMMRVAAAADLDGKKVVSLYG